MNERESRGLSLRKVAYELQRTGNQQCEKEALEIHKMLDNLPSPAERLEEAMIEICYIGRYYPCYSTLDEKMD